MQEISSLKSKPSLRSRQGKLDFRPLIAFAATLIFYLMLSIICQKYPFGAYSTSISDLDAQYAPFLALFRNKLGTETFLAALKMYAASPKKNLNQLNTYAKQIRVEKVLRQYLEVLL